MGCGNTGLVEVSTKINRDQIVARYEADQRKREREQEREAAKLRGLTCPYCERRQYDGQPVRPMLLVQSDTEGWISGGPVRVLVARRGLGAYGQQHAPGIPANDRRRGDNTTCGS